MASGTLTITTPVITGTLLGTGPTVIHATNAILGVASGQTATIQNSTAQSSIDFASCYVRVQNTSSTSSVTFSVGVGTEYSSIGIGAASISLATNSTIIVGGKSWESARFQTSAETVVFTQTGSGPTSWEAYQSPRATE